MTGRPSGPCDLHSHDLRHEGACRLLADGVDPHPADARPLGLKQTQRYLNITDEEALVFKQLRQLGTTRDGPGRQTADSQKFVNRPRPW